MITIRAFEPEDAVSVSNLVRRVVKESLSKDYPEPTVQLLYIEYKPEYFKEPIHNQKIFIAEDNSIIVGTAAIHGNLIMDVFVDPDYEGKGIGSQLLAHLERLARLQGHTTTQISANPYAIDFYEKLGYFKVEETYLEPYDLWEIIVRKKLD
ncbi:MAG: GNAT family N-acetyltransferase [Candidatus Bathyarchaeota archaeon]|nr:MAG: GNAT family N-acetyltransferase [Candidatus Bathyarchaeota archaeon]